MGKLSSTLRTTDTAIYDLAYASLKRVVAHHALGGEASSCDPARWIPAVLWNGTLRPVGSNSLLIVPRCGSFDLDPGASGDETRPLESGDLCVLLVGVEG